MMSNVHWPMPGRDTTEFPNIKIDIDVSYRDHLYNFLQLPDGISRNDYTEINKQFTNERTYQDQRIRTFMKMYERLGILYPYDTKLYSTSLGKRIYNLKDSLENFKAKELSQICSIAIMTLSKYQFSNPLDQNPTDSNYHAIRVHPYFFLWKVMESLDYKIHYEEINRVVLWSQSDSDLDQVISKIQNARKSLPSYTDTDNLIFHLGNPVFDDQVPARIAPLFSNAGWGGLIIANKAYEGFRHITELAKPILNKVLLNPPLYFETDDKKKWIDYYYEDTLGDVESNNPHPLLEYGRISKSLLLLAGISGTGKTRFVREQAKTSGQFDETYCLASVRPDWHEPSDLLGYISRLSGDAEYVTTDVLQFIAKAWRAIKDSDLAISEQDIEGYGERLVVSGERDALSHVLPYWLCLDEMNLAPVEQYFADYLSVLETREWCWDGENFTYTSDALLKPATINEVTDKDKLRSELGFASGEYDELWQLICQYGLAIPFNLMVAGTVNMDETTHGFSRKVIDRALSFDFGVFFPNDFNEFFAPESCNKRLSYPILSHASKAELAITCDKDGTQSVAFLSAVNAVLKNTPFELAFRALNELLLAVVCSSPQNDKTLKAVWDDFMMCKVLPRIEGDIDKLTTADGNNILTELSKTLETQLAPIWQEDEHDTAKQRPDLFREKVDAEASKKELYINCRTQDKLTWMQQRLASAAFTSFWP